MRILLVITATGSENSDRGFIERYLSEEGTVRNGGCRRHTSDVCLGIVVLQTTAACVCAFLWWQAERLILDGPGVQEVGSQVSCQDTVLR